MDFKRLKGKYWMLFGALSFLGTSVSSIIRSIWGAGLFDSVYISIDWLAACIPYFFLGAILGFIVDSILERKLRMPLWLSLTLAFWIIGSCLAAIFTGSGLLSTALMIFFPFVFGIFFAGSAYVLLVPKSIESSLTGKIVFDILYLGIFLAYFY